MAIETQGLTHRYMAGQRPALNGVDLAVEPGEIFGILGPNGGGKTTLFRILATLLNPSAGAAAVFGLDTQRESAAVRRALGVVFQSPSLDNQLTATENLIAQGGLYGLWPKQSRPRASAWLERLGLAQRAHDRVEQFSGGMRRRVEIAKALIHQPRLLLMDEPATGLDPTAQRQTWADLDRLRQDQGVTICLTTHLMNEAERCDRLAIISQGQLVAVDRPAKLKSMIGGEVITLEPAHDEQSTEDSQTRLGRLVDQVQHVLDESGTGGGDPAGNGAGPKVADGRIHIPHEHGPTMVATLFNALPGRFQSITLSQPSLEDVFVHLTGSTLAQAETDGQASATAA